MIPDTTKKVNTQKEALAQGIKRYFTGIPCARGHVEARLTSSRECMGCKREREQIKYKEGQAIYRKQLYEANREEKIRKQRESALRNYDTTLAYGKKWRNQNKERIKQYRIENAGAYAFYTACRRRRVKRSTPPWAELDRVKLLYEQSATLTTNTGIKYAVDHFIPITNKIVCGLHCIANLRVITREENATKGNKFFID